MNMHNTNSIRINMGKGDGVGRMEHLLEKDRSLAKIQGEKTSRPLMGSWTVSAKSDIRHFTGWETLRKNREFMKYIVVTLKTQ